jgi:hypothetical protein
MTYLLVILTLSGNLFAIDLTQVTQESHCRAVGAEVYKLYKDEIQSMMCVMKLEAI